MGFSTFYPRECRDTISRNFETISVQVINELMFYQTDQNLVLASREAPQPGNELLGTDVNHKVANIDRLDVN